MAATSVCWMEVARRARAFGMELVGHDPFVSVAIAKDQAIRLAGLEEVYAAADYITLHVGLTPQTTGMINQASIAKMKKEPAEFWQVLRH